MIEARHNNGLNGAQLIFAIFHVSQLINHKQSWDGKITINIFFTHLKNPPYDVVILKPDGYYTYTRVGVLWQSRLAQKLNLLKVIFYPPLKCDKVSSVNSRR